MNISIKRVYDPYSPDDGTRVLVDRLWPRGISKQSAHLDLWLKEVAPSPELRVWFNHRADRFDEFSESYKKQLDTDLEKRTAVKELKRIAGTGRLCLLYAAHDAQINHAAVLQEYLLHS